MSETKKRILIVEDESSLSRVLQSELSNNGFETKIASNGQEALDILGTQKFDLILLDLLMPVMDGFQLMGEMSKNHDDTPVIVTTNLGQDEDKEKVSAYGVQDYLIKTDVPLAELVSRVKNFLNKSPSKIN